jgi:hypothetical protein
MLHVASACNFGIQNFLCLIPYHTIIKSCLSQVGYLRRIRPTLEQTTVHNIVPAVIHSIQDYCKSIFLNLPPYQLDRLQLNSAACAVTTTSKFNHLTPVLESLHRLKISERIVCTILYIIYKCLLSNEISQLRGLLTVQILSRH